MDSRVPWWSKLRLVVDLVLKASTSVNHRIPARGDFPAQVKYSPIVATVLENKTTRLDTA